MKPNSAHEQKYTGLPLMILIFAFVMFSPLIYFIIQFMLGNGDYVLVK